MSLNPNGSHLPALVACVVVTDGAVLELGMGEFSTPVLHALTFAHRRLLSVDSDHAAVYNFSHLGVRHHEIRYDFDYRSLDDLAREAWSVVLVDSWPPERRTADTLKFLDAEYLVVHDAEIDYIGPPLIERATALGRHVKLYKRFEPWTLIVGRKEIPNLP